MTKEEFRESIQELVVCFRIEANNEQLKYWYEKHFKNVDGEKFKAIIPRIEREEVFFPSLAKIFEILQDEFSDRFHSNYYEEKKVSIETKK